MLIYNQKEEREVTNMLYVAYAERNNRFWWIGTYTTIEKAREIADRFKASICTFDTAVQLGIYPNK